MSTIAPPLQKREVIYPDDDGLPMADNTKQFGLITTIQGNLDGIFASDANVFVAGNLLWYPIEGDVNTRTAPDIFVAFGRPKGYRGSYKQWLEANIAPQVVFEILSPGNRAGKLIEKFQFYDEHGVEEYYIHDPDDGTLDGWRRSGGKLKAIPEMNGWISPLMKIKFALTDGDLQLFKPNGEQFLTFVELTLENERARQEKEAADLRAEKLTAQLRALGVEPGA